MIKWYAACDECTMSHYTPATRSHLLMSFDDQTARRIWARDHAMRTGHSVLEYFRRFPDPPEYAMVTLGEPEDDHP